eukprot:109727_1
MPSETGKLHGFCIIANLNRLNITNLSSSLTTACQNISFKPYSLQFEPYLWWDICVFAQKFKKCKKWIVTSANTKTQNINQHASNIGMLHHQYYVQIHYIHHAYVSCPIFQEIFLPLTMYYMLLYPCTHKETLGEYTFKNAKYYPINEVYLSKVHKQVVFAI